MERVQFLYYFESPEMIVIESKRLDLSTSASLSDIYKWITFSKDDRTFRPLSFRSMTKNDQSESRHFSEGELTFDDTQAQFSYKGHILAMTREDHEKVDSSLKEQVENFLLNLPKHH